MKTLKELRKPEPLTELTASQDPPTVLVLRRKAIRLFPHNQRVATYKNDNLDIEIAIPYTPNKIGHVEGKVAGVAEEIDEAMSPELKRIRKERTMFKRDLTRAEDHFDTSKQRLDWAKRALAGHIKKHGKTLDPIGECIQYMTEETIDEMSAEGMFGEYLHSKDRGIEHKVTSSFGHKAAHHFIRAAQSYLDGNHEAATHHFNAFKRHVSEETTMMEATIHSLHAITRTQHPAQVRFKDGSSAMIDHPTAAQIMKLHSKVNRQNKKKIEGLINSGPTGIRKVSDFIRDHMK
jgi:hypothetical protein